MTYEEALEHKKTIGEMIAEGKMRFNILVVPDDHDDSAKEYSLNGEFKVCGLWTDGANVVHREL